MTRRRGIGQVLLGRLSATAAGVQVGDSGKSKMQNLNALPARLSQWLRGGGLGAQIAKGASGSFFVKIAGTGIVFLLQVFLARLLGTEKYGIYVYALSWINTCLLAALWGWDTTSIRLIATFRAKEQWGLLRGFMVTAGKAVTAGSIGVAIVFGAGVWLLKEKMSSEMATVLWIGCLVLPINAHLRLSGANLMGFRRVVRSQIPQVIFRPLLLAFAVSIVFLVFAFKPTASAAMLLNGLAAVLALVLCWRWVKASRPAEQRSVTPVSTPRVWARIALPLMLVSSFRVLLQRIDVLMLGVLIGPTEAGIYFVAGRIAQLVVFGLVAAESILAPIIADFHARGKLAEMQRVLTLATAAVAAVTLVVATGILLSSEVLLGIFGPDFVAGRQVLVILVAAQAMNSLTGPVGFLMTMTGNQASAARILGFVVILNAVLNLALIPVYGIEGAAVATALSVFIWQSMMVIFVRYRLHISPTVFSILKLVR